MNKGFGLSGILIAILIVLAVGTAGVYVVRNTSYTNDEAVTTKPVWKLYTNETNGFEMKYPQGLIVEENMIRDGLWGDIWGEVIFYNPKIEEDIFEFAYPEYVQLFIGEKISEEKIEKVFRTTREIGERNPEIVMWTKERIVSNNIQGISQLTKHGTGYSEGEWYEFGEEEWYGGATFSLMTTFPNPKKQFLYFIECLYPAKNVQILSYELCDLIVDNFHFR